MIGRGHDPYAPWSARGSVPEPEVLLPVEKLRRCGASDRAVEATREWWDRLDQPARERAAGRLAVMSEPEVSRLVALKGPVRARRLRTLAEED